jgi:glycosyltransferase involved in cell wall biosynthesis
MKVALVYDRVNTWGGAERVLLALHKLFPEAPLYTSVYHPERFGWAKDFTIKKSFLQSLPFASRHHELLPLLMPIAFESFSFDAYDLVISITSESAKGVITKPHTKHLCYCLTPTRYLWSGYETYFHNKTFKFITKPTVNALRKWDTIAANRPDMMIAISEEVRGRIKKYYGRDSLVIYPPVTFTKKTQDVRSKNQGDYFLIVSRLSQFTKYKRVDLAIEACNALKLPLKIVGGGNWLPELQKRAGSTITFVGKVTDDELVQYYDNCKALIFPGLEDFGLTMIEAHQFGKPVIAFRGGGAVEILIENKTGYFFDTQNKESLIEALKKFGQFSFDSSLFLKQAKKFSFDRFKQEFLGVVNQIL